MNILVNTVDPNNTINLILLIIVGVISLIDFLVVFITGKKKNFAQTMEIVQDQIEKFMVDAENMKELSGTEKKDYVMKKTEEFLAEQNLQIPIKTISSVIENVIDLTKNINKK